MSERTGRVGVVLAGGYSTRFGEADKALASVDGTPMVRRVVDRLGRATDAVVVNCRADQRAGFADALADADAPVAFALDPVEDAGPLAGLAAGLACHDAPETVLVACDMPFVDPDFLAFLGDRRREAGADAAVPVPDGDVQPAQVALTSRAAERAACEALADGRASLRSLYERLDAVRVDAEAIAARDATESLRDVNERQRLSDR